LAKSGYPYKFGFLPDYRTTAFPQFDLKKNDDLCPKVVFFLVNNIMSVKKIENSRFCLN